MTRNQICNQLSFVQLMPSTLKDVRFDLHYGEFSLLFEEYDPYKIRKNGSYKDQLEIGRASCRERVSEIV